jgi:hypothetical protein
MTTMIDEKLAVLRTHRNNISRYRRLLKTNLTELEREYIERRLSDEQLALETLIGSTFPVALRTTPDDTPNFELATIPRLILRECVGPPRHQLLGSKTASALPRLGPFLPSSLVGTTFKTSHYLAGQCFLPGSVACTASVRLSPLLG